MLAKIYISQKLIVFDSERYMFLLCVLEYTDVPEWGGKDQTDQKPKNVRLHLHLYFLQPGHNTNVWHITTTKQNK